MDILFEGRVIEVVFEGRVSLFKPRLITNEVLQERLRETLTRVAPEVENYSLIICQWRAHDHPTGQRGGYCQYSTRTLYLEDIGPIEDQIVWNRLIETVIHELAHLLHGPSGDSHGQSWVMVCADLLARAHRMGLYDCRMAKQSEFIGDEEYRRQLLALVEDLIVGETAAG